VAFTLSYTPRTPFAATEARTLITHKGSLYCGTGLWRDADKPSPGPQIIRLDSVGGNWQLEQAFPPPPVNRIAIACLAEIYFPVANQTTLVCGFFGGSAVGVKTTGGWTVTPIGNHRGQIRSFISHVDNVTGVDMAFAGADEGIFSGVYDVVLPGTIQWATTPELDISGFPVMYRNHPERVMSFAELRGVLYATVGQKIFRRDDGHPSSWTHVWTNPQPGLSNSGLRGMTAINGNLWVCPEGTECRVVSVDATTWQSQTEYDISQGKYYQIAAYNDICTTNFNGSPMILIGLDGAPGTQAKYITYYQGTWSRFDLPPISPHPMVSVRTICSSPFNTNDIYFGGYDCNDLLTEPNRAWVARYQ
jgi:hypothetical protein